MEHLSYESVASAVWNPDLVPIIAEHLPPNAVACTLRLVNKEALALFSDSKKVNVSQPVPEPAFAWYLSSGDALRKLNRDQRLKLLTLTAASGSLPNLKLLLRTTIRYLTGEDVDPDELPGDQLWDALEQYAPTAWMLEGLVFFPASSGQGEMCRWLLARGFPAEVREASLAAARGGHLGLMEELQGDDRVGPGRLTEAVAEGCGLEDLTQLYQQKMQQGRERPLSAQGMGSILAAAAASPVPDWKAKLGWLEAQWQGRLDLSQMTKVADKVASSRLADSAERLAWLRGRGYPLAGGVLHYAATAGNMPALTYLLDTLGAPAHARVSTAAVEGGHLAALQLLHARGCPVDVRSALRGAMQGGHLTVVSWLVGAFGVGDEQLRGLTATAVRSCSLPLLCWLHERGCFQAGEELIQTALQEGCSEEALEWLEERGCVVQGHVRDAGRYGMERYLGHSAFLRCLERLEWDAPPDEVPEWLLKAVARRTLSGPKLRWLRGRGAMLPPATQETIVEWIRAGYSLCSLQWLAEQAGGPVDWEAVLRVVTSVRFRTRPGKGVMEWVEGQVLPGRRGSARVSSRRFSLGSSSD